MTTQPTPLLALCDAASQIIENPDCESEVARIMNAREEIGDRVGSPEVARAVYELAERIGKSCTPLDRETCIRHEENAKRIMKLLDGHNPDKS